MTAGQISKLHNLCLQINLLAAKRDDAPVVIYTIVGDNKFAASMTTEQAHLHRMTI